MSNSLQPHGLQHVRLLCPPLFPRDGSNSCPLSLVMLSPHLIFCHPPLLLLPQPSLLFSSHISQCGIEVIKVEILVFFQDLRGKACSSSPLSRMLVVQLSFMAFIRLSNIPSVPGCLMLFYYKRILDFLKLFNSLFRCGFFFPLMNLTQCITLVC